MTKVDTVLLKIVSRCNIDCAYCYVYHLGDFGWSRQPKRMSPETCSVVADKLHELAFAEDQQFAVVLHGGEPLLLGKDGLGYVIATLRRFSSGYVCNQYPNQRDPCYFPDTRFVR